MMRAAAALVIAALAAGGPLAEGNRLYRRGDAAGAERLYRQAVREDGGTALERYDLGTALLRQGRWDAARAQLEAARGARAGRVVTFRAAYNGGNTDLEPVFRDSVPREQRRQRLERAIAGYRAALRLVPRDRDAKWNLELATRLLEEEKKSGGGGSDAPDRGGGGGGGDPEPAAPTPAPGGAGGPQGAAQSEAERIVSGAEAAEGALLQRTLKRDGQGSRPVRDW